MAISPPNFSTPSVNVASLLSASRRRRQDPFAGLLDQAANFAFNSFLQQRSQEARRELEEMREAGRAERSFARDRRAGLLQQAPPESSRTFTLPGESIEDPSDDVTLRVPTISGPPGTRFEDEEFVSTEALQNARRQAQMAQPLDRLMGRETIGDVRRRDLFTPQGGQRSTQELLGLIQGDPQVIRDLAAEVPPEVSEVAGAARARLRSAQSDGRFTAAEEQQITEQLSIESMADYAETARQIQQMDREQRSAVATARRELGQKYQVLEPSEAGGPMRRRLLKPNERDALALAETGHLPQMSEEDRQMVRNLNSKIVPRIGAPDIQKDMRRAFVAAGNGGTQENADFVNWIDGMLKGPDDEIRNEALAERLRAGPGGVTEDHIRIYATKTGSADLRAAFALYSQGYHTPESIMELKNLGFAFPFGLDGAIQGYQTVDPNFGDMPVGTIDNSAVGRDAQTGEEAEASAAETRSQWEDQRQTMRDSVNAQIQRGGEEAQTVLAQDAMTLYGSQEQVKRKLQESIELFRNRARDDNLPDEEREALRADADLYEGWLENVENNWEGFRAYRDSVFFPVLRETKALEGYLNLDELPQ